MNIRPDFSTPAPIAGAVKNCISLWRHDIGPWAKPTLQGPPPRFGGWCALNEMRIVGEAPTQTKGKPSRAKAAPEDNGDAALEILNRYGVQVSEIVTGEAFEMFADSLDGFTGPLAFDTETAPLQKYASVPKAGLSPWLARWRLMQLYASGSPESVVVDVPAVLADLGPERFKTVCIKLLGGTRPIIAHNAKFELAFAWTKGIDIPWLIDTAVLYAVAYNASGQGLANVVRKRLGVTLSKDLQTSDWSQPVLSPAQLAYAALDPVITLKVFEALQGDICRAGLESGAALVMDAVRPTARADLMGVPYDVPTAQMRMTALEAAHEDARAKLLKILDDEAGQLKLSSGRVVAERLLQIIPAETLAKWEKTKTGQLKLAKGYLPLLDFDPAVKAFAQAYLAFTSTGNLLTYARTRLAQVNPVTGRFHFSFRLNGARTGRFGSSPNIQNWSKRDRMAIRPADGRVIVRADYSQVELRVYACAQVGDDAEMRAVYAQQGDMHIATACGIAGITETQYAALPKQEAKALRQRAKAAQFGLLYGMSVPAFARYSKTNYGIDLTKEEAEELVEAFFSARPALGIWQQRQSNYAEHALASWTVGGRRRNLAAELEDLLERAEQKFDKAMIDLDSPDLDDDAREDLEILLAATRPSQVKAIFYRKAGRAGMNAVVQGSATDVLLRALWRLDVALSGLDATVICHVHDEIVLEASEADAEEAARILEREAKAAFREMFPTATDAETEGLIDAEIVRSWAVEKDFE